MADKPSRSLILYGHGLASLVKPTHTHLHSLASISSCAFLALDLPSSPGADEFLSTEFAQLLDAGTAVSSPNGEKGSKGFPTIAERFMGMKAALITSNPNVKSFGDRLGFTAMELGQSSDDAAFELLKLLGFQGGKTLETDHFDLVFVHIGSDVKQNGQHDLDYLNNLIGRILEEAKPGSEVGSRLHLSVVVSFGASMEDDPNLSLVGDGSKSEFAVLFPRQSYTLKGVDLREGIRHNCPMLMAQWQDAVTRKDMVKEFSFNEFRKHSGNLALPADRFLYEVAFKLWKAPKYGA